MKRSLTIKKLKFSWGGDSPLFNGIDLQIPKTGLISIWGPSGVGKSTLMSLLQRMYKPQSGNIFVDNTPVNKIDLNDYRKNVTIVPQEIKIFNGTIAENILLGRPIGSFNDLTLLLERYGFAEFLDRFGNGIYSLIGEESRQLSGGEKQIVGLARALFSNPSILIIDEGLNALDLDIEDLVLSIISMYAIKHAILISTHNLRIMKKTSFLYVLSDGKIVQKGIPSALLDGPGYFNSVYGSCMDTSCQESLWGSDRRADFQKKAPTSVSQS